jgi:lactoylglutathione lyase
MAISVGSKERVDSLTEEIDNAGYAVISEPRTTGDGYYESIIADPDGNLIEITL